MAASEFLGEYSEFYEVALFLERQRSDQAELERWDGVEKPKTVEPMMLQDMCLEVIEKEIRREKKEALFETRRPPRTRSLSPNYRVPGDRFYWGGWGYLEHQEPDDEDEPWRKRDSEGRLRQRRDSA